MLPSLIEGANEYDRITMQCLAVVVHLHTDAFELADQDIGELLAIQMHEEYMAVPLMQGLGKIYQALMALQGRLPSTLSARIPPVYERTMQLYKLVQDRSRRD
jgi:hypothetical protein